MAITSATLDELLKRLYPYQDIENLVNLSFPVLNMCFGKGAAQLGGSGFYFPVRTEAAEGHAFISETDDLPTPQQTTVKQALVTPKIQAGVVQLTGLSMAVSATNAGAFARAFDENVQSTIEAMSAYREGVAFRDGTGILATLVSGAGTATGTFSDVANFREGMRVAVFDKSTEGGTDAWIHGSGAGATAARLVVQNVDWVNKQVTFTASIDASAAAGDEFYIASSQSEADGTAPVDKEPIGTTGALVESGTYLGIPRATNNNWKGIVQAESGFLDEDILLRARTRLTQESGIQLSAMGRAQKGLSHPMQADVLFKLAIPRVHYSGTSGIDLGNSAEMKFGNMSFCTSYLFPTTEVIFGDWSKFNTLYTPGGELHIDTTYNGSALKWVSTKDQGLVFVKSYYALACKNPQKFVRITGLSEPGR